MKIWYSSLRRFMAMALLLCAGFLFPGCGREFRILLNDSQPDGPASLYWSESSGTIHGIYTDGTSNRVLLTCTGMPLDIAVYAPGKKLYWTEYTGTAYQIRRAGIDGTVNELFSNFSASVYQGPTAIAIDSAGLIYWSQYQIASLHDDIWRSGLDSFAAAKWNSPSLPYLYGISLDTVHRKLYFSVNSYWDLAAAATAGSGYTGSACYCDMDVSGGTVTAPVSTSGPADPSVALRGIAVDSDDGYVYYVANSASGVAIMRADLDFQNSTSWISANGFGIQKIALDLSAKKIYWTSDIDNGIYRADLNSQNSGIELFVKLTSTPTGIALAR